MPERCAYCGMELDGRHNPSIWWERRRAIRARQQHPLREATALRSHEVVDLIPGGRVHAETCARWVMRRPRFGGISHAV